MKKEKANEYDDIINSPRSSFEDESEEEKRLISALQKSLPSYKNAHKPLKLTGIGNIILEISWIILNIIVILLSIKFLVPFALNINVTFINAFSSTVLLYILKYWWHLR